jgi:energy-coupling factor transporter ATP-binding protein EcfA2
MQSGWRVPDETFPASWRDVAVRYFYQDREAVGPITLRLRPGERLLLLGPSGSGKSTLLATLTGLVPQTMPAEVKGETRLFGRDIGERTPAAWADSVAQLFQDADQTLCGMTVRDEIAFALENRGLPEAEIAPRVEAAMARIRLPQACRSRRTTTLSGGEKQLVALAAALAQEAPLFVADEPTAHLAPEAAAQLRELLMETETTRSVLVVDHRLDHLIGTIDRVAVIGGHGGIVAEGEPRRLFREHGQMLAALGVWRPTASLLDMELAEAGLAPEAPPLTVTEALRHLDPPLADRKAAAISAVKTFVAAHTAASAEGRKGEAAAQLLGASCAPLFGPVVLGGVTLALHRGEAVAILGRNGAGKSTLGASLAGLLRLKAGRREGAPGGMAFQNPESQFVAGSVREEAATALDRSMRPAERLGRTDSLLAAWSLAGLGERHPFELSQGQKRRLALLTLTAGERWPLLVLDEPTAGLDAEGAAMVALHVEALRRGGHAIAIITHDMDFALRVCPRSVVVGEGTILADGPTQALLRDPALLQRAGLEEPAIAPAIAWLERHAPC